MFSIFMKNKIVVVNDTTIIRYDGDATSILDDDRDYIVHRKNILPEIKEAIRRGDNYVEVD